MNHLLYKSRRFFGSLSYEHLASKESLSVITKLKARQDTIIKTSNLLLEVKNQENRFAIESIAKGLVGAFSIPCWMILCASGEGGTYPVLAGVAGWVVSLSTILEMGNRAVYYQARADRSFRFYKRAQDIKEQIRNFDNGDEQDEFDSRLLKLDTDTSRQWQNTVHQLRSSDLLSQSEKEEYLNHN